MHIQSIYSKAERRMSWQIEGFIWLEWVIEKIWVKHGVTLEEVEEAFYNPPYRVLQAQEGKYRFYGCAESGRYLFVVFVRQGRQVRVITARDMTDAERRFYNRK